MNKLIFLNRDREDSFLLENAMDESLSCIPEVVKDDLELKRRLEQSVIGLVIIQCRNFGLEELNLMNSIRVNHSTPVLIVAQNNEFPDFFSLEKEGRTHIIYSPINVEQFIGLSRKLLSTKKANSQNFRRYETNQNVDLELLQEGETILSKLCNLSLGGAYCEFVCEDPQKDKVRSGDLIRINVPKSDQGVHQMNARVVWKKKNSHKDVIGVGLKFVKLQEL